VTTKAAVQVVSSSSVRFALNREERSDVASLAAPDVTVEWLPARVAERKDTEAGSALESTVFIFLLGLGLGSIVKPLVEEAAREAGKDLWKGVKKLVSGVWRKQAKGSYNLQSVAYLVLEQGNDSLAIALHLPGLPVGEDDRDAYIERIVTEQLQSLAYGWDALLAEVARWNLGGSVTGQVHVVRERDGKWVVYPVDSREFFR
jgi:hypothetical protein